MRSVDFNDKWATATMSADLTSSTIAYAVKGAAMNMNEVK